MGILANQLDRLTAMGPFGTGEELWKYILDILRGAGEASASGTSNPNSELSSAAHKDMPQREGRNSLFQYTEGPSVLVRATDKQVRWDE